VITLLGEVVTVICVPRPWTRPSAPLFRSSLTSKSKQTEQFTSCTSVSNSYSQYFSTQCPIVYYTWFTVSTLGVKSVFWNTHTIHVFLNSFIRSRRPFPLLTPSLVLFPPWSTKWYMLGDYFRTYSVFILIIVLAWHFYLRFSPFLFGCK
jgi:hypothetical protein